MRTRYGVKCYDGIWLQGVKDEEQKVRAHMKPDRSEMERHQQEYLNSQLTSVQSLYSKLKLCGLNVSTPPPYGTLKEKPQHILTYIHSHLKASFCSIEVVRKGVSGIIRQVTIMTTWDRRSVSSPQCKE